MKKKNERGEGMKTYTKLEIIENQKARGNVVSNLVINVFAVVSQIVYYIFMWMFMTFFVGVGTVHIAREIEYPMLIFLVLIVMAIWSMYHFLSMAETLKYVVSDSAKQGKKLEKLKLK